MPTMCLKSLNFVALELGPVARSLVSANRWLRGIKMYRFPWYLNLENNARLWSFIYLLLSICRIKTIHSLIKLNGRPGFLNRRDAHDHAR